MADYTSNYNLKKPLGSELYNIEDQNSNMDIIDDALANRVCYSSTEATYTGKKWIDGNPIYTVALQADGNWTTAGQWVTPFGEVSTFPKWFDDIDVFINYKMIMFCTTNNGIAVYDVSNAAEVRKDTLAIAPVSGRVPVHRFVFIYEFTLKN